MAIFYDAPVNPVDQTTFIRNVPVNSKLVFRNTFPASDKLTNRVNFAEITQTNRVARYRSFDGRIHVADRDGGSDRYINLPPLSDSANVGEYERLQLEFQRLGGTNRAALVDSIYDDSQRLTNNMNNRLELGAGQLLSNAGVFSVNLDTEPGYTIDYGVPSNHKITVGTAWATVATADPLADLTAACDTYETTNGFRPGIIWTDRATVRKYESAAKVINAIRGAQTGVTMSELSESFRVFASRGIPTDWRIVETSLDVDGVATKVLTPGKIILGPPDPDELLDFTLGISATALELVNSKRVDMSFQDAAGFVGVVIKEGPPFRQFTFVDGVGMPILKDAKKLMVVTV